MSRLKRHQWRQSSAVEADALFRRVTAPTAVGRGAADGLGRLGARGPFVGPAAGPGLPPADGAGEGAGVGAGVGVGAGAGVGVGVGIGIGRGCTEPAGPA